MTTTPHGSLDQVLSRLEGVRLSGSSGTQFVAQCPAHDDSRPSLSVRVVGQAIYLKCFVGCERDAILKRLGLTRADLRLPPGARSPQPAQQKGWRQWQARRGSASHPPRSAATVQHSPQNPGDSGGESVAHTAASAPASAPSPTPVACTVAAYAERKGRPEEFLRSLGLRDVLYQGSPAIRMPYLKEDGTEGAVRFRTALEKSAGGDDRFKWKAAPVWVGAFTGHPSGGLCRARRG